MSQHTAPASAADVDDNAAGDTRTARKNDPREVFGWMTYDWANSAFYTTVVGALYGEYLTYVTQQAVGPEGVALSLGPLGSISAKSYYPLCITLAVMLQIFLLPLLGAIADYSNLKKRLMAVFCYTGASATALMYFVADGRYLLGGLLFLVAMLCFNAAIVLYNSYLPQITTEDRRDKVSSRGFALGYLGGGLLLLLNSLFINAAPRLGLAETTAVRLSLFSAGIWWGGFALITFLTLRSHNAPRALPPGRGLVTVGFSELGRTFRELRRLKHTFRYLLAYLFFIDGVQTIIGMAGVFLAQELFVSRGAATDRSFLIGIFLMVQFMAIFGALLFERVAAFVGTKRAIMASLVIWSGIVIYAYAFLQTTRQAWWMAAVIAVVLGGTQALSRSLFSRMIPAGREASFFGLYEISERASWMGLGVFTIVVNQTGSYRQAILFLIFFFAVGLFVLLFTDTDRAIHEAGNALPEEVAPRARAGAEYQDGGGV